MVKTLLKSICNNHIFRRNMASCFFVLHFPYITLFIFLARFSLSNGDDGHYTACGFLYSCGDIQGVGYPFWGDNRPEFCGIPDFKLSCHCNDTSESCYTKMDVFPNATSGYLAVFNISMSSHTMAVSQEKLFDKCHLRNPNDKNWLSTLKPAFSYKNISIFYGCNSTCASRYNPMSLSCYNDDDSSNSTAYYFDNLTNSTINRVAKSCSCMNNVTFAVNQEAYVKLKDGKASLINALESSPIVMKYNVNFTACSKCEKSHGRCGSSVVYDQLSNQFACYYKPEKNLGTILGLGIGGGIFVLLSITVIWAIWQCKKLKYGHSKYVTRSASLNSTASELEMDGLNIGVPLFSYTQLAEATHNFDQSKELGSGGFGIVYHGKLKDGREVAIKRLYEKSYRRMGQFMNEIEILTRLRHQNLVSLYGCTSKHSRELILVYEYVKNGTVADHLYGKNSNSGVLPWPIRLRIAIEIATALSYLHASDIIHRDVKSNNILLDSNFCVKVADFGLSRLFPTDVTHVSTAPQGTPGYLDPEYHLSYKLTDKSDVYSFGVVLIELISSQPAINMDRDKLEINLANYAMNRIQRSAFDDLVDPQLGFALDYNVRRMTTLVAELAFQCLQSDKEFRPTMDEVLQVLKRIESGDYETLQAEKTRTNDEEEMLKMHRINPQPPSPTENDQAQLLRNHQVYPPSPISVIDKWTSKSSTSSSSKQDKSFIFKQDKV